MLKTLVASASIHCVKRLIGCDILHRVVEEEGAERVAQVHQELERVKVYTFLVYVVLCVCVLCCLLHKDW